MPKPVIAVGLFLLLGVAGYQLKGTVERYSALKGDYGELSAEVSSLETENSDLEKGEAYLSEPTNLLKEIRKRLNYRRPDEEMIIVVPKDE
jgi:cell division protein FtsB